MIKQAFNYILNITGGPVEIDRPSVMPSPVVVKASAGNYFRNLEAPADIVTDGREFVMSYEALFNQSYPLPLRRGDRIYSQQLGEFAVTEVREMHDIGGEVIGYRVRCG